MLQIAEANTIPMETTEEQLLRSEPLGSEQGTTETKCYSRQTSLSQREKDTKHTQGFYNTEKDHCKIKAAQDIVAHPVVRLDGLITIVRRQLKQEGDTVDVGKLDTSTRIIRLRPKREHKGRR